jgi:MtrB/PioB family decaheme-associated outer membrane protein
MARSRTIDALAATLGLALAFAGATPAGAQETGPGPAVPAPAPETNPPEQGPPMELKDPPAPNTADLPPADEGDGVSGEVELSLQQVDVDTISSKFTEYRDVPNGLYLPFFRLRGAKGDLRYMAAGRGMSLDDQQYLFGLDHPRFRLEGDYNQIPHRFGNAGRSMNEEIGPGVLRINDTVQASHQRALEQQFATNPSGINFTFLNNLVAPSLSSAHFVDLALERERTRIAMELTPDSPLSVSVRYLRERRTGDRSAAGTAFGFNNVVETPEPVHYLTQDFAAAGQFDRDWGMVRAGIQYNSFANRITTLTFDNPFRITDSTDSGAYQAPGSGSIGGPTSGLVALPPDNEALTGNAMALVRLAKNTRVSASVQLGTWKQNETPFIPYGTNTAITTPVAATDPNALPARSLDGEMGVTAFTAQVTSRPLDRLNLFARYRSYDLDNETPRISFPGYVRFDAAWNANPRISVPYSFGTGRFDASAGYDFDKFTLEGFVRHSTMDRTFRETEETTETGFGTAVRFRASDWALVRASFEWASRDFDHYDPEHSEHASFVNDVAATNQHELLRYDQAKRDYNRIFTQLVLTPGGAFGITLAYAQTQDDYTETEIGLTEASYRVLSADVDYTPSERWSVYGFYSRERNKNHQNGRQSGSTPSTNPLDDWTSEVTDDVDSVGGGLNVALVPDKWSWNTFLRFQQVDGFNDLSSPPGGTPDVGFPIEDYDDTQIFTLSSEVSYRPAPRWTIGLGGWFEDYDIQDAQTTGVSNYTPGSFFLAANDGPYRSLVGWLKLTYRF